MKPDALKDGWNRDRILSEVEACGTPCFAGSCSEVYLERAFDDTEWRPRQRLPIACELGETSLMFLVHPTLGANEMTSMAGTIRKVMGHAMRTGRLTDRKSQKVDIW